MTFEDLQLSMLAESLRLNAGALQDIEIDFREYANDNAFVTA